MKSRATAHPRRLLALAAGVGTALAAQAQSDESTQSVVVVGGTNYQVQQTLKSDVFEKSVHLQETAPGFKSPYLGAFTGNQVDLTLNGIRMNNALFRGGPNQYYSWVPASFARVVTVSDGGNVGGTVGREIGVPGSEAGLDYDSSNRGVAGRIAYKAADWGVAGYHIDTDNLRSRSGTTPHSAYNQGALMFERDWNPDHRTVVLYSASHDIERTDKWNGGIRSSGTQKPAVYTWQLQQYAFVNHRATLGALELNLGLQDSLEHILDGSKHVRTDLLATTVNATYRLTPQWSVYSTNTVEHIDYHNAVTADADDSYITLKQGVRYGGTLAGLSTSVSLGLKQVRVSGVPGFHSAEGSVILGKDHWFGSLGYDTNAPGYASLKQSTTSGRGTSVPNPDLKEEHATTIRLGYNSRALYVDVYLKKFTDAITSTTVAANTYKPVNGGQMTVKGATVGFDLPSVADTGVALAGRLEFTTGRADVFGKNTTEPLGKVPPYTMYLKTAWRGAFAEWRYAPKDNAQAAGDLDDVRIYAFNRGYNVINLGYAGQWLGLDWVASLNNLFNNDGRVLGSSVNVAERSLGLSGTYRF